MGSALPELTMNDFRGRLAEVSGLSLSLEITTALWTHYEELRRWNRRLSLVGPGTALEVIERHYGESLLGLEFLGSKPGNLVDIGSGGGFPGIVLATAASHLKVTLVEPKQKKWAFLSTCIRRCGLLSCQAVNARVERPFPPNLHLPSSIDWISVRALVVPSELFEAFSEHSPNARFLVWCGKDDPDLPTGWSVDRELPIDASAHRRVLDIGYRAPTVD